ncbi:MAG: hypothetical protein V7603_6181 [Micromonosporaceae bacterium]
MKRRWPRLAIPFAVAAAVLVFTGIMHAGQSPDVTDPAYLNPDSGAAIGGRSLADRLRGDGVRIERVTRSSDALLLAHQGDATLFVPAPSLMHPFYLRMLKLLPESTRVVLVAPSGLTLDRGLLPAAALGTRWATATAAPGCALPEAVTAGRAAIAGTRYRVDARSGTLRCYAGALVGLRVGPATVLLAGANEPFRNDRIGEYHNAALATGLLRTRQKLIWLDLHRPEPRPGFAGNADPGAAPPSLGDAGSPDPDFPIQVPRSGDAGAGGDPGGTAGGASPNPFWSIFPGWMWAALGLLGLIAVILALASGRRLGPPVGEPLPVVVPAAETVAGRGRLYRRAKARGPALFALRAAALHRLLPAFGLPADAPATAVVQAVSVRTGRAAPEVESILYGPDPDNDEALVRAVDDLDTLVYQALGYPADGVPLRPATMEGGT